MAERDNQIAYPWLETTGQLPKYHTEVGTGLFWLVTLPVQLIAIFVAFFVGFWGWIIAGLIAAVFVLLVFKDYYVFYWTIKCPHCGHNPTRKKNGKPASRRYLEGKFKKLHLCPQCGK